MNKRSFILSFVLCLLLVNSVQAEQKQYLQIIHEKQYKRELHQEQKLDQETNNPVPHIKSKNTVAPTVNKECEKYVETALSQLKENNIFGAQTSLTRALDINPNCVKALKMRGEVKDKLGDYTGALQDLNKAVSIKADGDTYYARGMVWLSMQNYPEAIKDFSKTIEFNPSDSWAYHQRGYCYCLYARVSITPLYFNKALPDFNKSIQLNSGNIESYLYRGMAKAELNGASAGLTDIEYAMNEYKRIGDNNAYQRSVEIYNWIKRDY